LCEQGKPGNTFTIISSGVCAVLVHDPNSPKQRREVAKLHRHDYFGELAILDEGVRTATVIAETAVSCLSLTRRHFELYLHSIKDIILEQTASKHIMKLAGGENEDLEEFHAGEDANSSKGKGHERVGKGPAHGSGALRRRSLRTFHRGCFQKPPPKRTLIFRCTAQNCALERERERVLNFEAYEETKSSSLLQLAREARCSSLKSLMSPNLRLKNCSTWTYVLRCWWFLFMQGESQPDQWSTNHCKGVQRVQPLVRKIVLALEMDVYTQLLNELIERPTSLPEFNKIMTEVLHKDLKRWNEAYALVSGTVQHALSKSHAKVTEGEVATLSAIFRLKPSIRQHHCSDWPDYQWINLLRHMQFQEVESLDKVFVWGAHGTKAYILLRGLVRVLHHKEGTEAEDTHQAYLTDLLPGDVIGDNVLEGISTRTSTVVAVTKCHFATVEYGIFANIRDHGHSEVSLEEKYQHIK
ncbi:unnamed protein product, partial [Discosporangium mesarthrocarpum]